jgi:competence protein ComFC
MANIEIKLNQIKEFILDLIFPRECVGCSSEGGYLCKSCLEKIDLNSDFYCALCKRLSEMGRICYNCQSKTSLKAIWVAANYNNKIFQDLIHNFKYNYLESISADLALLLSKYLQQKNILKSFDITPENAILVPVPLHRKRFLGRGFNQSELLAKELGKLLSLESFNLLKRVKNTETQINLNRSQRQENVKDAFEINGNFANNKKIILIDDVVTTGSTLKECSKALAAAGYQEIYGLVIAQRED